MIFSALRYQRISPLLWFSGVMVVILGGLTIWLHNEVFIQIKPTIYYGAVAMLLLFGLKTGRNLLKVVLGTAYPGLDDRGWKLLTRNWVIFFIGMACLNELVWRTTTPVFWAGSKLWLFVPLTFIFAAANVPMLLRHGLGDEAPAEIPPIPPE
jgi:intracellular septation protein